MLNFILYGVAIVVQLIVCFLVYYATLSDSRSQQKKLVKRFYILSASTIFWSICQSAYDWSGNLSFQSFVLRMGTISTILVSIAFLAFTFTLVNKHRMTRDLLYIPLVFSAFLPAMFTQFFDLSQDASGTVVYKMHFLIYGYITLVPIALIFRAVLLLVRSRKKTKDSTKTRQFTAVLHGMLLSATIAFVGNFVLVYIFGDSEYSSALTALTPVVFTITLVYAVFSLKMFNFRKFITSVITYGLTFTLVYSTVFLSVGLAADYTKINQRAITVGLLPLSIFLFIFSSYLAKKLVKKITKSVSSGYSLDLIREAMRTISSKKLLEDSAEIIRKTFGLNKCAFIFITSDGRKMWHEAGAVTERSISSEELSNLLTSANSDFYQITDKHLDIQREFSALVPLDRGGLKGALLVGEKVNGRPIYSDEQSDIKKVAFEVSLGVENTIQFEKIKQFNKELEQKIDDATGKLRKTNEKLKALDEAKDEFISMASHQLRTPLTSIKGYISLILDGDMGKVPTRQKKMLQEAFSSSQRMVYLISDLLNVSRLKTGKFLIEPTDVYLPDVVEEEIDQVKEMAEVKNIKIHYSKPKTFTHIELDDMKIRQVIMNFIDNAIHYTPEGGEINVELKETDKSIEFRVIDSGIGVPKAEQHHLFTKFYRAGNARKARPDGTGLGLFMGKKVIVASGGSIIFSSEEGKGSTFGFVFPKN